jgi:hypothetical protein
VLYALASLVALVCIGLAIWGWLVARGLDRQLVHSAHSHAELLAREFSEETRASTDRGLGQVFRPVSEMEGAFDAGSLALLVETLDSLERCDCADRMGERGGRFAWMSAHPDVLVHEGLPTERVSAITRRLQRLAREILPGLTMTTLLRADEDGQAMVAPVLAQGWLGGFRVIGYVSDDAELARHHFEPAAARIDSLRFGAAGERIVGWRLIAPGGDTTFARGVVHPGDPAVTVAFLRPRFRAEPDSAPRARSDPATTPYRAMVQVHPEALGHWLYGPVPSGVLPIWALVGGAAALGGALLLVARRVVRQMQEREAFVTAIAHDLRTPLTQILLYGESMQLDRPAVQTREQAARVIVRETRRLIHLVENALAFARTGRATPTLQSRPVELGAHLAEVVAAMAPVLDRADVTVSLEAMPGIVVHADPDALTQIVTNLLDNAVRFGPRGQRLRMSATRVGTAAAVVLEDDGPGIPPELREEVFQPFVTASAHGGTGIGLAVSRQLAELMEGTLRAGAPTGRGARLELTLPLAVEG